MVLGGLGEEACGKEGGEIERVWFFILNGGM